MFYKYRNKKVLPCSSADEEALNTKTKLDLTKLFYCGVSQLLSVRCKDIENIFNTQTIINKI